VEEYYAFGTNQTPYSSSAMYSGLYGAVPTACALGRHATPSRRQQVVALQLLVPLAKTLQRLAQTVIVEGSRTGAYTGRDAVCRAASSRGSVWPVTVHWV
jgi:hypothetical protein